MSTANNGDQENMETTTTPSSLSSVASSSKRKAVNTKPMGTGLEARGVHAWFGNHHALADVSLDFAASACATTPKMCASRAVCASWVDSSSAGLTAQGYRFTYLLGAVPRPGSANNVHFFLVTFWP